MEGVRSFITPGTTAMDRRRMEHTESLFVVMHRYGPPYDPGKKLEAQPGWEEHRVFMNALQAQGVVRLGGPLEGREDVLLVLRADSAETIRARLADDPWIQSGILRTTRIARWDLRLGQVD